MSLGLQTWFTGDQNQWVQHYRHDLQTTKIYESRSPDVIYRWPKLMSRVLQTWFTGDQNQWVQWYRCDLQTKNQWVHHYRQDLQTTKINESTTTDMIYKLPKSMSPGLKMWSTDDQNQWVQASRRDPQTDQNQWVHHYQKWFTNYQNQWVHHYRNDIQTTKINESRSPDVIYR